MGQEALQIVKSGGTLSSGALKNLIKHHIKSVARERIKQVVYQGIERLLQGQLAIAQASGVDICRQEEETLPDEQVQEEDKQDISSDQFQLPTRGILQLTCQHNWEDVFEEYGNPSWQVEIDWESRTFTGTIEATSKEIDGIETIIWNWNEQGSGIVTEDGFLWGDFHNGITLSVQYGDNDPNITDQSYDQNWIGAIADDLSRVCFYRIGAVDWLNLDWNRERGRNEMLEPGSGLCEATCPVH